MAGVKDNQLEKMLGWPEGLDNLSAETELPTGKRGPGGKVAGSLRVAQNVNIDDQGKASTRDGYTLAAGMPGLHSLYATPAFSLMLGVYDGELIAIDIAEDVTTLATLASNLPMSYDLHAGWVYYSNGFDSGRVNADGTRQEWAIVPPLAAPSLAAHATVGGLDAGTYQVTCTFVDSSGRESGACESDQVEVVQGGGVLVTSLPDTTDGDVTAVRVYCSKANGTVMYYVRELPLGTSTFLIGVHESGKALDTEFQEPLPAGQIVRFHNGRQFVFRNKDLFWSEALHPGQGVLHANYLRLDKNGDLIEGCGEGPQATMFIAAGKRTYQFTGDDPKKWTRRVAHPHGAVPGSSTRAPATMLGVDGASTCPYWMAADGQFVVGTLAGVALLHADRYAAEINAVRGSSVYTEVDGCRRLLSVLKNGLVNPIGVTDSAEAEVWRNGVRIS